jgi:hypothetical protein
MDDLKMIPPKMIHEQIADHIAVVAKDYGKRVPKGR